MLLSSPGLWRFALVPMVALVTLSACGVGLVTWFGVPQVLHAVVTRAPQAWYTRAGSVALATVLWLVGCALVLFLSWVITPVLCSPALEAIVQRVESALGAPPRPQLSFWASLSCGLRAQLTGLGMLVPIGALLWVLGLIIPLLAPMLLPAKLLVVAFGLAWNLLDYPLTLRGVPARERVRFIRRHWSAVAGFGLGFALLFWLPLGAVLLLPLGVIGATRLVWALTQSESAWGESPLFGAPSNALSP